MRASVKPLVTLAMVLVAPGAAHASMTLVDTKVEGIPTGGPGTWDAPEDGGTVTWTTTDWTGTYTVSPPASIPDGGTTFDLMVTAESRKNSAGQHTRFVPVLSAGSTLIPDGHAAVSADASSETQPKADATTTVQLRTLPNPAELTITIQDGPTYTFVYDNDRRPAPGTLPPPSAPSATPQVGVVTSYTAPPPGKTLSVAFPALGAVGPALTFDVRPTTDTGEASEKGDVLVGVQPTDANLEKANVLCYWMWIEGPRRTFANALRFARCATVVARILQKAEDNRRPRPAAAAAKAGGCRVIATRARGSRPQSKLRATCRWTSAGLRVNLRAKRGSLRSALGSSPKLLMTRTRDVAAAPGDRLNVTWKKP